MTHKSRSSSSSSHSVSTTLTTFPPPLQPLPHGFGFGVPPPPSLTMPPPQQRKGAAVSASNADTAATALDTSSSSAPALSTNIATDPLPTVRVNKANLAEIKTALDDIVRKVRVWCAAIERRVELEWRTDIACSTSQTRRSPPRASTLQCTSRSGTRRSSSHLERRPTATSCHLRNPRRCSGSPSSATAPSSPFFGHGSVGLRRARSSAVAAVVLSKG